MSADVRVRFAPSPTGPLHIGGVRTALFNYLFAKKHGGTFVLRIEDTDQSRFVPGAEAYITEALDWCGIPFDEGPGKDGGFGPYRQSERQSIYSDYALKLVQEGKAYYAFDTNEDLQALRDASESEGETFIYNWHNRTHLDNSLGLSEEELQSRLDSGAEYVIRFKSPKDRSLVLKDMIRGEIEIDTNVLDDKVLFKGDGMPTYHLANIIDDHLMEISHVIRGEEWLPSLALHYLLYEAFEWDPPQFAHLPLILKPTGKGKLSKRDGDKHGFPVFPLEWKDPLTGEVSRGYREDGYFPEAVVNFLVLLGWNPGTEQEFFSIDELILLFDLDKVQKGGARFDPDKTKWFNHHYMQKQNNKSLASAFKSIRPELAEATNDYIESVVSMIKERATFVQELWSLGHYFFRAPETYDEKSLKKAVRDDTASLLTELVSHIRMLTFQDQEGLASDIKAWINSKEIGFGRIMMPLRLSLVGALEGPDVFAIMFQIGKEEVASRLDKFIGHIGR